MPEDSSTVLADETVVGTVTPDSAAQPVSSEQSAPAQQGDPSSVLTETEKDGKPGGDAGATPGEKSGETQDPVIQALEAEKAGLQKSLRAVSAERNKWRAQAQGKAPAPSAPESTPPGVTATFPSQQVAIPDGLEDAGTYFGPALSGMPYDPDEKVVCIGDPAKPRNWIDPQYAMELLTGRQLKAQQQQLQRRESLSLFTTKLEDAQRTMREKALPFLKTDEERAIADEAIQALTSLAMGQAGLSPERLSEMVPEDGDKVSAMLTEANLKIRRLAESISRSVTSSTDQARKTEPVPASGTTATPANKSISDMTFSERVKYTAGIAQRFIHG